MGIEAFRFFSTYRRNFVVDLFKELTLKLERKKSAFKIIEGLYLDKNKSPWNKLSWDEEIEGLVIVNY